MTATTAPFILNLATLANRPGSSLSIERQVQLPEAWGTEVMAIPAGASLNLDGTLDRVLDGVYVHLVARAEAHGECVRCLRPVTQALSCPVDEMFFTARAISQMRAEGAEDTDELPVIGEDEIDVEQVVRDALVSSIPFQVLCEEDCPGLCANCGIDLREAAPDHHHEVIDPRWAKLAELAKVANSDNE